ncbi:MAG: hypothetical protein MUE85_03660 [Microscillaceae bacterium]|jgi:hypothetical protein|nr:hypothetical protein [Microscillaceae bacterium]
MELRLIPYYDTRYKSIAWNPDYNMVCAEWKDFAKSDEFKESISKQIELLKNKKSEKLLLDARNFKGIGPKDQEWAEAHHIPALVEEGLKKLAIIASQNIFGKVSLNNLLDKANHTQAKVRLFATDIEAMAWLMAK